MNKPILLIAMLAISITMFAQTPQLVKELSSDGNITRDTRQYYNTALYYNGGYLLNLENQDLGRELYYIKDDDISLIKDFKEGPGDSFVTQLRECNGYAYFHENGIWRTDGTPEGTELVVDYEYGDLELGGDGNIYFGTKDSIFYISKENGAVVNIGPANYVYPSTSTSSPRRTYPYKNGIAFVSPKSNEILDIFYIDTNGLDTLFSGFIEGMDDKKSTPYPVGDDLIFRLTYENGNEPELLRFNPDSKSFHLLGNHYSEYRDAINEDLVFEKDYEGNLYTYTKGQKDKIVLDQNVVGDAFSWPHIYSNDKLIYRSGQEGFENQISIADSNSTQVVFSTPELSISEMIIKDNLVFFASGVGNGQDARIHMLDLFTNEVTTVYQASTPSSSNTPTIEPICVLDNKLYMLYSLNSSVGKELFSLDVSNFISSTKDHLDTKAHIKQLGESTVLFDSPSPGRISIYDLSGNLLNRKDVLAQEIVYFDLDFGLYVIYTEVNGNSQSQIYKLGQ